MAVAIDHRDDRLFGQMFESELHCRFCGLGRQQRIDHYVTGIAFNDRDVRHIEPAQLVNTLCYLKQPVTGIQLRLAPEAGIDGCWRGIVSKRELGQIPDHVPCIIPNLNTRRLCDQTPIGECEVLCICKRQLLGDSRIRIARRCRRRLAQLLLR